MFQVPESIYLSIVLRISSLWSGCKWDQSPLALQSTQAASASRNFAQPASSLRGPTIPVELVRSAGSLFGEISANSTDTSSRQILRDKHLWRSHDLGVCFLECYNCKGQVAQRLRPGPFLQVSPTQHQTLWLLLEQSGCTACWLTSQRRATKVVATFKYDEVCWYTCLALFCKIKLEDRQKGHHRKDHLA